MRPLAEIEQLFVRAISQNAEVTPDQASPLAADGSRPPARQLEVYREQFWLRHLGSLRDDFRALIAVIGDDAFEALATKYLLAHPPRARQLSQLGAQLPEFAAQEKVSAHAIDAARLDWTFMAADDALDVPPLVVGDLGSIAEDDWPRVILDFHPGLHVLKASSPIHKVLEGVAPRELVDAPTALIICREPDLYVRAREIDPSALKLLEALREGVALGPACEEHFAADPAPPPIALWFSDWVRFGWITSPLRLA